MNGVDSVAKAFEWSTPYVEKLSSLRGPFDRPHVSEIEDVVDTLWSRRGKRIRSHLVYWFSELVGREPEGLELYAWAAEAVHTATLLHDDVIDEAALRRGGPSANKIYDNTIPILSGDYLIADVVDQLSTRGNPELFSLMAKTLKQLCSGEVRQYQLKNAVPDSLEPFYEVVVLKTTSLFTWSASVGPILSHYADLRAVRDYIRNFGLLFQMSDDLLDVVGTDTKHRWTDLKGGKLNIVSWQLVHADPKLRKVVARSFRDQETEELPALFERHSQLPKVVMLAREELKLLASAAMLAAERFPEGEIREALKTLPHVLVERCS